MTFSACTAILAVYGYVGFIDRQGGACILI